MGREGCGKQMSLALEAMARSWLLLEVRRGPLEELRSDIV